jgi:hypothetical protein
VAKQPVNSVDRATLQRIPRRRIRWKSTFRLVPARYPPIDVFERVAGPADWELLDEMEGLTDPRLRQAAGQISLVPPERRVSGAGASAVMAPFTHPSTARPTRFSAGTYGVYYAGHKFETALREVAFHMGRFYAATSDPSHDEAFRTYEGSLDSVLHDIRKGDWSAFLDPDPGRYRAPQELGRQLREQGSNGIVYPSVRHVGGECLAAFWPDVVTIPVESKRVMLRWDGARIAAWFDFASDTWSGL